MKQHTPEETHATPGRRAASAACCGFQDSEREPIFSAHTEQT